MICVLPALIILSDKVHNTPLHCAAYFGHAEVCAHLIQHGAG